MKGTIYIKIAVLLNMAICI